VQWTDHSQFSRECPQALELPEKAVESVLLTRAHGRRPPETTPKPDRVSQFMVPKLIEILLMRHVERAYHVVVVRGAGGQPAIGERGRGDIRAHGGIRRPLLPRMYKVGPPLEYGQPLAPRKENVV